MSTITVYNAKGAEAGTAELPAELFDVTANIPLIHQVVVAQLAAARQGTHSTKTRGDVRGGGKKPYRQKGTGRARQGSTRSPQFAGGGIAHGPHPHGYAQRTPKKMIAAALRGALSDRARDGRVYVIDDLIDGDVPSTKTALAALASVTSTDKVLVVIHRDEDLAWLSLRNVSSVHALAADQLNAYDVLVNDEVVFTAAALDAYVSGPAAGKWAKAVATSTEAGVDETDIDEPSNDELAAASVEESAEPSNEDLAATAASASLIAGPTSSPTEFVEPAESVDDLGEPVDPSEAVDPPEPVEALAEPVETPVTLAEPVETPVTSLAEPVEAPVPSPVEADVTETEAAVDYSEADVPDTEDVVAEALVEDTYTEGPYGAGSYVGEEPPPGFDIKGNEDSKLFHTPDSPYYSRTVAEVWFSSPEAAEVAGFTDQAANDSSDETEESK